MINPYTEQEIVDPEGRPVREPDAVQADAEFLRARLAPAPVAGQIKTPDAIIDDLEFAKHAAAKSVLIIRDADKTLRAVTRLTLIAHGKALKASEGKSSELREADAFEATVDLHAMQDDAEITLNYAKGVAKAVEGSMSAVQTQSKMVAITYGLAGSGREQ